MPQTMLSKLLLRRAQIDTRGSSSKPFNRSKFSMPEICITKNNRHPGHHGSLFGRDHPRGSLGFPGEICGDMDPDQVWVLGFLISFH